RRRHTRCLSDWSSDVCSSDLGLVMRDGRERHHVFVRGAHGGACRGGGPAGIGDRVGRLIAHRLGVELRGGGARRTGGSAGARVQIGRASCRERGGGGVGGGGG